MLLTVAAAALLGSSLRPVIGDVAPFSIFYSAVAASAWFGGFLPGVMATLLGAAAAEAFFVRDPDAWSDPGHTVRIILYLLVATFLSYVIHRMQQARRRSEAATAAARASAEQLRLVTDALPAMISYVDHERRFRLNNRAYVEWFGTEPSLLNGKTVREVVGEEAYQHRSPFMEAALRGETVRFEGPTPHKDLGVRETEIAYVPDRADGRVRGFFVLVQDITERKRTEDRLREETETVETINRTGRLLAAELDLQKLVQNVVDATTGLTGAQFGAFFYNVMDEDGESYSLYALSGVPREAFDKFPMPRNTQIFAPTFRGEGVVRSDDITKDPRYGQNPPYKGMPGGHLPVRSYLAVPVVSRGGEVLGGLFFGHERVGVFDERDERVVVGIAAQAAVAIDNARLYQSIRSSEERFRQLAENIREVVYLSSVGTPQIMYVSPAYAEIWGRTCESLYADPLSFLDAVHADDRQRVVDALRRQSQGEETQEEYRIVRPDGQVRWIWDRAFPIRGDDGQVVRVSGIAEDITERKQAEAEREQLLVSERAARSEAERANRLKDEFLATLSHELRTPLNAILGWAQILRASDDSDDVRQGLETIERSARAQAQIVEDLLDMSRIISGNIRLEVRRADLAEVVAAALETVRPAAEAKRIELRRSILPRPCEVWIDPNRLQQVIWNLLSNAIKFTPAGGSVEVTLVRDEGQATLTVSDTGTGIKPEFLPHVFERFRQADASTTRRHGGLGLGLAIVRHLVELHGGTVAVHSDGEDRGTKFTLTLPSAVTTSASERESVTDGRRLVNGWTNLQGTKVLVVDDEPDALALVQRVLREAGAEVVSAGSADDAMRRLMEFRPDAILSDIGMPGCDGYGLIRRIRQLGRTDGGAVPAAAMTAFARSEDRRRALQAGFQIHLPKPIESAELVAVVASLTGRTQG